MKKIEDLNKIYTESESVDKVAFADQRSNLLLIAGEHYTKTNSRFLDRVRSSNDLNNETKIRLTMNHIQRITKIYANEIGSGAPNVRVMPQLENELQDRKAAEMHQGVWRFVQDQEKMDEKIDDWLEDYVGIGEVATKIYFDKTSGPIIGYEQLMNGQEPMMTLESGEEIPQSQVEMLTSQGMQVSAKPAADKSKPKFKGQIKYEELFGFNLLRDPEAKSFKDSAYLIVRKMAKIKTLKKMFPDKKISESNEKVFLVFDNSVGHYRKSENTETLVREYYYRQSTEYPNGYYYITTEDDILEEGELPFGLFPIVVETFDRVKTSPRGFSIVKTLRPYQVEINRCASKMAEHQMTLGDDKLITLNGSKVSSGASLPGIRHYSVTGQAPVIMEGRTGMQYHDYMTAKIDEMYQVAMIQEMTAPNSQGQFDPYSMLYQSAKKKKNFQRYVARFERFLRSVCEVTLEMARHYLSEEEVIYAVGKKEQINMAEFKNSKPLCYQIKVEPQSEDVETLLGKQLVMNNLLQYVGSNLSQQDMGKIIKNMPYANLDESFNDLTIDYENSQNLMLALERGETPAATPVDNAEYMLKKLNQRMKQADFAVLHPFIQSNYQKKVDEYGMILEQQRQKVIADNADRIPTSGSMVGADIYVSYDPQDPTKSRRARIPYDAVKWLLDRLEAQGTTLSGIDGLPLEQQALMPGSPSKEEALPPPGGSVE